jgi:murein DD-endopeptidase MepM/ murein hydrolase activator NlpD
VVRAAGGGVVLQTGAHEEYGNFVLLEHPDGYQSMYGHLSRILAVQGMRARAGEVIALSGNSGRSSAPHLHFEIRLNGLSIDPGTMVKEER